ncbi:MAG: LuxR C-terminal-related transcriptional regulator [Propionibacteriaceae bacterium]
MTAASLIARDTERAQALHSLRFSNGVLIAGEAGVGKTALAAWVVDQLPTPPVGWVVATSASGSTPLGALSGFLPPDLATIHPALVAQRVDARLRELNQSERRSSVPLLVVDDAQLLDAQSAAVLLSLVTAKSLRLLATMRTGGAPSDAVTALWKEQLIDRLDLEPLDRAATRLLLEALLGGPVASGTQEMLWTRSHGNPFYVTELARYGADNGQMETKSGVWWWVGESGMPPRLGELLLRRLSALSPEAREAADVLALGEPLPYETLAALVDERAILELDETHIITSDERNGVLRLRFSHPLLHTVAERQLSATRRWALARRLREAPAEHVDLVRRATWEEVSGEEPNVELLLDAADSVILNDATAAVRLAARAQRADPSIRASLVLSAAQSELGHGELARATLDAVASRVQSDADRYAYGSEDLSLALWSERQPDRARQVMARMWAELPSSYADDLGGSEALIHLFTAQPAAAIPLAQAVLDRDPAPSARIRALTCLTGALAFADRGAEAIAAGQQLLESLATVRVAATRAGLAHALIATAGLFYGSGYHLPLPVGSSGRWPGEPEQPTTTLPWVRTQAGGEHDGSVELGWPLLVGLRRHLDGDLEGALGPLREAYVQQLAGEGLFRSEATAELVIVLAELGHAEEAGSIMSEHAPDSVAIIPGLRDWCEAAVAAATGHASRATELAVSAARTAAAAGAPGMAMNFLTDAGRYGNPRDSAPALADLGVALDSELQQVRAADIMARAQGRAEHLIEAAQLQLSAGFARHALELAHLAQAVNHSTAQERQIAAIFRDVRLRLGAGSTSTNVRAPGPLTQRESEVARLASNGLSDREIAEQLYLSIRTVQSHLASAYRKLGISSRSELSKLSV